MSQRAGEKQYLCVPLREPLRPLLKMNDSSPRKLVSTQPLSDLRDKRKSLKLT